MISIKIRRPHRGQQAVRLPLAVPPLSPRPGIQVVPRPPRGSPGGSPPRSPPPPVAKPGWSKGPCGTTFCYSQSEIYDIGTEILFKTGFGHNSTQNERKSTIFGRIFTEFYVDSESGIKTRFKALFKN